MNPTDRPAEWTAIAAGIVAVLVLLGIDANKANAIGAAVVAIVPGLVTLIVSRSRKPDPPAPKPVAPVK